jgi:hypothetical protein
VWALVGFGAYSGYKLIPVAFATSTVERAVESALEDIDHTTTDEGIRRRIAKRAGVSSISLEEESIRVDRESRPGERIVHVAVDVPVTVNYLGERTFHREVRSTRVIRVNETALARAAEREREYEEEHDRRRAIGAERGAKLAVAMAECEERHGRGNCRKFELAGGDPDEIVKLY